MKIATWKKMSKMAKFVKYHINRRLGEKLQDVVDDMYENVKGE